MQLSQFKALSFDCYGTLIDWEAGMLEALEPLRERAGIGPDELLEAYGAVEHELERAYPALPYSQLLEKVHDRLSERFGLTPDNAEAAAFGTSVGNWPAFPDSARALAYLKGHFQLIILSNVDRNSFAGSARRLGVEFDQILTAEEIGSYKPDLRNFEYLLARAGEAGIAKHELLHVAQSLFHDHVPANRMGIASAWIDRRHDKPGGGATIVPDPMPHYDLRFASLGELAAAHKAEQARDRLDFQRVS
jgi:2-haloalkanoic acid dehalogenase type II